MNISQLLFCCAGVFVVASATAVIDPSLKQRLIGGGGGSPQNVMVSFTQSIQSVIQQINSMNFSSAGEKRTALTNAQEMFTNGVQGALQGILNTMGVKYESFWISNKMVIQNVSPGLVNTISNIPGVAKIEKEPVINLNPMQAEEAEEGGSNSTNEWGITQIRADQVWNSLSYKGKGIVVANIDTGVRYTHESLKGRWRKDHGWFDPYFYFPRPYDLNGHGTHTMGTIVGENGIGVAPAATWIACKGCTTLSCFAGQLLKCAQWVQCPTNWKGRDKNCTLAPHIVSNSWGGGSGDDWYDGVIKSWHAAAIIPVFAIGNAGPKCGTANSPGDRPNVIAVGSTDKDNQISEFSSLGPSKSAGVDFKPDIAAPGGNVRSAWHTGDKAYNTISGTSMACPHVSGVVALMKEKNPAISYDQVYGAITRSANRESLDSSNAMTCGEKSPSTFPNNVFGYGLIDALNSVNAISASSSE